MSICFWVLLEVLSFKTFDKTQKQKKMKKTTNSAASGMTTMQAALLGAGLGTQSQAKKINSQRSHDQWQKKMEDRYRAASRRIAAGDRSKEVLEIYSRLRGLVSPEVRRLF